MKERRHAEQSAFRDLVNYHVNTHVNSTVNLVLRVYKSREKGGS
jgi:hypothetical protein